VQAIFVHLRASKSNKKEMAESNLLFIPQYLKAVLQALLSTLTDTQTTWPAIVMGRTISGGPAKMAL
jgi:hypothetical protein